MLPQQIRSPLKNTEMTLLWRSLIHCFDGLLGARARRITGKVEVAVFGLVKRCFFVDERYACTCFTSPRHSNLLSSFKETVRVRPGASTRPLVDARQDQRIALGCQMCSLEKAEDFEFVLTNINLRWSTLTLHFSSMQEENLLLV
jgi:hypothetical protein